MSLFRTALRPLRPTTTATATALRTMSTSATPMEDAIREKLTASLSPSTLLIRNDSHLHAHHAAMAGSTSRETHFQYATLPYPASRLRLYHTYYAHTPRILHINYTPSPATHIRWKNVTNVGSVTVTSPSFAAKMQPARHRMVYALLKDEMSAEGGIHALQLRTRTPEEEERQAQQSQ